MTPGEAGGQRGSHGPGRRPGMGTGSRRSTPISLPGLPSGAHVHTGDMQSSFRSDLGLCSCSLKGTRPPLHLEHPIPRKGRRDVTTQPLAQVHPPPPPEMPRSRRPRKLP